jgi:hypothetical protein
MSKIKENLKPKDSFVVGRKHNNPIIYTHLSIDKREFEMDLSDVIETVTQEFGSQLTVWTKAQFKAKLTAAFAKLIAEMKDASLGAGK